MKKTILTDAQVKAARYLPHPTNDDGSTVLDKKGKPVKSPRQLTDTRGLYLKLMPTNLHSWRYDFTSPASGQRSTLYLGTYPEIGLGEARKRAQDARNMLAEQPPRCPLAARNAAAEARKRTQEAIKRAARGEAAPDSFKAVALDLLRTKWRDDDPGFKNTIQDASAAAWKQRMEKHVFPTLGARPVASIELQDLLDCLAAIPSKSVANHVKGYLCEVMKRARKAKFITTAIAEDLKDDAPKAPKATPRPAQTTVGGFARVLRTIREDIHKTAHRDCLELTALLWQRPANMAGMKWADLHLDGNVDWFEQRLDLDYTGPVWIIPAAEMKRDKDGKENGKPHIVPLPAQAIEILRRRFAQRDPLDVYVFQSEGNGVTHKNLDANTVNKSLKDAGLQGAQCMHGFRASGASLMAEKFGVDQNVTEMQLAHSNGLATGVSYQRAIRLEARAEMLTTWANYCDQLRMTTSIVSNIGARAGSAMMKIAA